MSSIKKQIEAEAGQASTLYYFSSDGQKVSAGLNPIKNEAWQAGALWAMRWWAERMNRLENLTNKDDDEEMRLLKEMDAAAKEVLG